MSKVAVILGSFSIGSRPLDFHFQNIWISSRGLTGTDLTTVMISKELQKLGNEVSLFTVHAEPHNKPSIWENVKLYNFDERFAIIDDSFDAIISINEPDVFHGINSKALKICWQFLNDFTYCQPGFDDYVDVWLGVCEMHVEHLKKCAPKPEKWKVLPLGCDPESYSDQRVPGRIIWCSSADRGLHNLLEIFPQIKSVVPEAHLKIFYHFNYGNIDKIEPNSTADHPHVIEMGQRIRYMKNAIPKLKKLGVEHIGSISKNQMIQEMNQASVFAFSADTVAFTEGFSVSTLEAHASFTVPVITTQDCLGSIYKDSGCIMMNSPVRKNLSEYTNTVIKSLTDKEFADNIVAKCRQFSQNYTWKSRAEELEKIILKGE